MAPLNPCGTYTALFACTERQHLSTKLYNKRDEFNFLTVNFPFISSNIPSAPAHGVREETSTLKGKDLLPFEKWIFRNG
jgi:hypothetical protein